MKHDARRRPRKDESQGRQEAEMTRLRAVIAKITAENLERKKRSEARRARPSACGDESPSDCDRETDEASIGLERRAYFVVARRSAQRVLRLEAAREFAGSPEQAVPGIRSAVVASLKKFETNARGELLRLARTE
ncbi:MAG: hypothetical protein ABIT36_10520, partial [Steroidobacteraceae bacterium]